MQLPALGDEPIEEMLPEHFLGPGESPKDFDEEMAKHIAGGPNCRNELGYDGHRISVEQMRGCNTVQCLEPKASADFPEWKWTPEPDDEDFEVDGDYHLTGVSDFMPSLDSGNPQVIRPRYGCEAPFAVDYGATDSCAMPFHPTCLEVFKRASLRQSGIVDVEGLIGWWRMNKEDHPEDIPRDPASTDGSDQYWMHLSGDEFVAANPCFIPRLPALLLSVQHSGGPERRPQCFVSQVSPIKEASSDPFLGVSSKIRTLILLELGSKDIANLQLVSRAFLELPQSLFYSLTVRETPWIWETWDKTAYSFWATTTGKAMEEEPIRRALQSDRYDYAMGVFMESERRAFEHRIPNPDEGAMQALEEEIARFDQEANGPRPTTSHPYLSYAETDWYRLQMALVRDAEELLGLRNRRRIWEDCESILIQIDRYRIEGKIPSLKAA
ncbi:hypothetical protein G7046_g2816 [Stylonectria norvegica]|nr:hypothetical protein G7046_g2816 [Stylonectria norvegica]